MSAPLTALALMTPGILDQGSVLPRCPKERMGPPRWVSVQTYPLPLTSHALQVWGENLKNVH